MDLLYKTYCLIHKTAKSLCGRNISSNDLHGSSVQYNSGVPLNDANKYWEKFIGNSLIKEGEFNGFRYAGYIAEEGLWILPSWIWTNAAVVRSYLLVNRVQEAVDLGDRLLLHQQECGGWIVRNDYDTNGAKPILAPNDSAYIANNAMISLYSSTGDIKYLESAKKCADWIIQTARPDGMVYVGYNMRDQKWDKSCVIVDVGFTGGLFARLYEITQDERYYKYLKLFIDRYISLFYIPEYKGFCTNIGPQDNPRGGMFSRGQAWALEGLIPAYKVLKDERIRKTIETTILTILQKQTSDGGWPGNLIRKYGGLDCKGIPVIAKDMLEWVPYSANAELSLRIKQSAEKALKWCVEHTANDSVVIGGIFSFNLEGGIVHNLYTSCAFVYASAYAIELDQMLKK